MDVDPEKFEDTVVPFHCTVEPAGKYCPFTVRVKPLAPAVTLDGLNDVIVGGGTGVTVKTSGTEVAAFGAGFTTVTL
jgi:hypothetical protein